MQVYNEYFQAYGTHTASARATHQLTDRFLNKKPFFGKDDAAKIDAILRVPEKILHFGKHDKDVLIDQFTYRLDCQDNIKHWIHKLVDVQILCAERYKSGRLVDIARNDYFIQNSLAYANSHNAYYDAMLCMQIHQCIVCEDDKNVKEYKQAQKKLKYAKINKK